MRSLGMEHRSPYLSRVVSVLTAFLAVKSLLRVITQLAGAPNASGRIIAHPVITTVQSIILLIGSIQLWRMRRIAALFFGAELSIAIYSAIFFTVIEPSPEMTQYKSHMNVAIIIFAGLLIELLRFVYVWWVTTSRTKIKHREKLQP